MVDRPDGSPDRRPPGDDDDDGLTTLELLAANVRHIEDLLRYVPLPAATVNDVRQKLALLRSTLLEQRPPALALVGRRGAGKSSLINALAGGKVAELGHVRAQTGRGHWIDYGAEGGALRVLDTRGFQEGSRPVEEDTESSAVASVIAALKAQTPDVIIFVVKATEVDSAIEADLVGIERIYGELERHHRFRPPLIAIASHCDVLEPKAVRLHRAAEEPEEDVEEKLERVAEAELLLDQKIRTRPALAPHLVWVRGVAAYMSFREDGTLRADERWRIDDLVGTLFAQLPQAGRGTLVRIARVQALQESLATDLTRAAAAICAAFAAVPIPVADLIPITSMQVTLVAAIAWLSGRALDKKAAAEFMGAMGVNVGAAFAFREGARALVKFVFPGAGSVVSSGVAFAGTMAIGAAARAYFFRGASIEAAKRAYKDSANEPQNAPPAAPSVTKLEGADPARATERSAPPSSSKQLDGQAPSDPDGAQHTPKN